MKLPISGDTVLKLHRMTRGEIWDAGNYKDYDGDIIEKLPDGSSRVRFKTVSAKATPGCMKELIGLYEEAIRERKAPHLVETAVGNFKNDFTLTDLERACPGVSRDMVRIVLRNLQSTGDVECLGRGPGARWRRKKGNTKNRFHNRLFQISFDIIRLKCK